MMKWKVMTLKLLRRGAESIEDFDSLGAVRELPVS